MSNFDDIIQQKANNHEASVPHDAWDNIINKKKKRRFAFFWWTICILLCGLSIVALYNYNNAPGSKKIIFAKNESSSIVPVVAPQAQQPVNTKEKSEKEKTPDNSQTLIGKTSGQLLKNDHERKPGTDVVLAKNENKISANKTISQALKNKHGKSNGPASTASIVSKENTKSSLNKKDREEKTNATWANKNNNLKKEKGRTVIKTQVSEAETLTEDKEEKKNSDAVVANEMNKNADEQKMADNNKNIPQRPSVLKKDLAVDSLQKKLLVTTADENKKEKPVTKKPTAKHPWFIDIAITPVLPIQQYDHSVSFNRTLFIKDGKSIFSGNLSGTSIDPSLSYSLSLRKVISKKLTAGIGIQYLRLKEHVSISGEQTNTVYNYVDRLIDNVNGPELVKDTIGIILKGERGFVATNSYHFLSIPVSLQYNLIRKKPWSLDVVAGVNVNIVSNYKNQINRNSNAPLVNNSQKNNNNSNIGFAIFTGLRVGRTINKRIDFFAVPSFSYSPVQQHIKNSLVNKKIHQAGISLGISYKFN